MFKKLKKWFLLGLLTITSGALIGTGISLANEDMTQTVAAGVTMKGGEVLYLKPNSNWTQANARFATYFFNDSSNTSWASMDQCEYATAYYKVTVPSGSWTKLIFCRMNPDATANNWNNMWDQTNNLEYDGTNTLYTIADGAWSYGGGTWSPFVEPGQPFYLEMFSDWTSTGAKFGFYYFNVTTNENAWSAHFLTKVEGATTTIYEDVVPEGEWTAVIAVRFNANAKNLRWNDNDKNVWNQTNDIYVVKNMNVVKVTDWNKGEARDSTFTEVDRAYCFSTYLISQTNETCKSYETNTSSNYSGIWENLKNQYNNMHISAKDYLKTAVADKNKTEDDVKIAMARYDHIVAKYGLENFLERETTSSSRLFANSINSNNSTLIIILASITAIGLISVLFITFKRKRA